MTAPEVIHVIRTILDDGLFWYLGFNEINRCVNQAQLQMIDKYHKDDDERALRPLYVYDTGLTQDATLSREILYPRGARIIADSLTPDMDSWVAQFISYNIFVNYAAPGIAYTKPMPRTAHWTFHNVMNTTLSPPVMETRIRFTTPTNNQQIGLPPIVPTCNVLYIAVPPLFFYDGTPLNTVGLSVPEEYHLEVALMAAELANNIDVGEQERGDIGVEARGDRLTLQNIVG